MANIGSVACVGIFVADAVAKPIDGYPERGKLELFDQLELHSGGCANNTAIALARLGAPTAAIGKVGNDAFGDFVLDGLKENGVDVGGMTRFDGSTSFTFVMVGSDGERSFFHTLGANAAFCEEDIRFEALARVGSIHIGGSLLMPNFDGGPTTRLLKWAQARGIVTSLDSVWDSQGRWLNVIGESLPYVDYFMPSIEEARAMTELEGPDDIAAAFLDRGVKTVVLKMGDKGSFIRTRERRLRIPVVPVDVADTTGAGDAYAGGFLAGVAMDWELERCGLLGSAAGAACVTAIGTTTGLRDLDATLELLDAVTSIG